MQSFTLRHRFVSFFYFVILLFLSAPLSRLTSNEALPHTPTWLCPFLVSEVEQEIYSQWVSPLDPDQGRVPGPFARFARCFILLYACNLLWSAMLTPHSSLNSTPHLNSYCILILFKQSTLLGVEQLVNDIANSRSVQPTSLQKSIAFMSKYLKSQT